MPPAESAPARRLLAFAREALPPNIALMRLVIEAEDPAAVQEALEAAGRAARTPAERAHAAAVRRLWDETPSAWTTIRSVLDGLEHDRPPGETAAAIAYWAERFDAAVGRSPEGSVALYSLGDPALLAAATAEIAALMRGLGLLGPDRVVLDLGCGIGRCAAALASEVGRVIGLDIAPNMVAAARDRCAALGNVEILLGSGCDLSPVAADSVDTVLAVDSVPYLVQAGGDLAARHFAEAGRVLRRGGHLLILNFSYRGDAARDLADAAAFAERAGLAVLRAGTRDLALWDGVTFLMRKP